MSRNNCYTVGVTLRLPPVADKGSKVLSELMSKSQHIYVQRIATIFQTGELGSLLQIKLDFAIYLYALHNDPRQKV